MLQTSLSNFVIVGAIRPYYAGQKPKVGKTEK